MSQSHTKVEGVTIGDFLHRPYFLRSRPCKENLGVDFIEWPVNWNNPIEYNRAILDADKVSIIKIEEVMLNDKGQLIPDTERKLILKKQQNMSTFSIRASIEKYYPEYYSWNTYPAQDCVAIHKANEEQGIFDNFGLESVKVDAMKFCLQIKYEQSQEFRNVLASTSGKIIVENQSSFKKPADTWGAKLNGDVYEGANLLGQLLMELRDAGSLRYNPPQRCP